MVLFLHNRYRTTGGEERAVEDLMWLVREHLAEPAELLTRSSSELARGRAALGLLRGGLDPEEVSRAVRSSGARVVHAHNLQPALGWRALAAARAAGARVVLHLHQYRLVCAVGVSFTRGEDCTRCHARNTLPGVRLNCRENSAEALAYGASLALWQRRLVEQADVVVVPSAFARERLRTLGAPLPWERVHVLAPPVRALDAPDARADADPGNRPGDDVEHEARLVRSGAGEEREPAMSEPYALVVSRLAPEKGIDVAIDACRLAGISLVIAGEGPELEALRGRAAQGGGEAAGVSVRFLGRVDDERLRELRRRAAIALVPSRSAETFGLAAAEAMAAGLPVAASRVGALTELVDEQGLAEPGDAGGLARAIGALAGDRAAGQRGLQRVRAICAPEVVARGLAELYGGGERGGDARQRRT